MFPRPRLLRNGVEDRPRRGDTLEYDPRSGSLSYRRQREPLALVLDGGGAGADLTACALALDGAQVEAMAHFLARLGQLDGVLMCRRELHGHRVSCTLVR